MSKIKLREMLENEEKRQKEILKNLLLKYNMDLLFTDEGEIEELIDLINEYNKKVQI